MAQTTPNTPFARVKAGFGNKKDLISKIKDLANDELWLGRLNQDKSWDSISNSKLLRLHAVLSDVKQRFGSRDKLITALVDAEGRGKDTEYKKHFATWPLPRLVDALRSAERRTKNAAAGTKARAEGGAAGEARTAGVKKGAPVKKGATSAATAKKGVAAATVKKPSAPTVKKGTPAKKFGAASSSKSGAKKAAAKKK